MVLALPSHSLLSNKRFIEIEWQRKCISYRADIWRDRSIIIFAKHVQNVCLIELIVWEKIEDRHNEQRTRERDDQDRDPAFFVNACEPCHGKRF